MDLFSADIMRETSSNLLSVQVVTRHCFQSRRDRMYRQLDDFHQVVFILVSAHRVASVAELLATINHFFLIIK